VGKNDKFIAAAPLMSTFALSGEAEVKMPVDEEVNAAARIDAEKADADAKAVAEKAAAEKADADAKAVAEKAAAETHAKSELKLYTVTKGLPYYDPDQSVMFRPGERTAAKLTSWLDAQIKAGYIVEFKPE
jgi:nucleoid-associated protein YgaU